VEEQNGDIVSTDNSLVTLSIATGPSDAGLVGTVSVEAVNGVATFNDVVLDTAGNNYTLQATDGTLAAATSDTFEVSPLAATQFVFVGQPTNITAGSTLPSDIVVYAEDQFGNVDTNFNSTVTLGLKVIPTGAPIFTPVIATAVNGTATFAPASIGNFDDFAGGYKFKATASGFGPGKSAKFFDLPAAAAKLVFVDQPTNIDLGSDVGTVTVDVEDQYGNILTNDDSTSITLGLKVIPSGAPIFNPVREDDVHGVATFTGVLLTDAGGYKFKATGTGFGPAKSAKFFVLPPS